ncbi:MAG: hypothetical protein N2038_11395 [Geminicoccaceae bacterium]|nr:hypothetical protein [Geminicoccaceae bacterium]MCS7268078.1 hypothetical protein [Geminicoccaceae bacterium]MCX7630840.1 hypothetical protein [Geminicoccaceae bacterium]MDW8125978.1 hypothetical protein [Geminicoccaceae bacterium]MDW8342336.1 hypothetical protein [Geminicoccaceae bacterium]
MRTARLTADLLVRRGEARAIADTYGSALLDPAPALAATAPPKRPKPRARPEPDGPRRVACRLEPEEHRRLRIAAARLGRPASALLREALARFLGDLAQGCACLAEAGTDREDPRPAPCCREER